MISPMQSVLLLLVCFAGVTVLCAPEADEVVDLPGLPSKPPFKHYSGYLRVSATRYLHYWFVESQQAPVRDPVVLWMNGGPGCSSMEGLLSEHGPFLLTGRGDLRYNSQAWSKTTNMLYLEAPAGVGYSYASDGDVSIDDDTAAQQNYNALMEFYKKFPEYLDNDFFISGESYAGVYVPTLARLVMKNDTIRMKGILVGNGLSHYALNDNSLLYFVQYHGLLGEKLWHSMLTTCCLNNTEFCLFTKNTDAACRVLVQKAVDITNYGLNIYNLYAPCYGGVQSAPDNLYYRPQGNSNSKGYNYLDVGGNLFRTLPEAQRQREWRGELRRRHGVSLDPPCTNSTAMSQYLNSPDVRRAIHIPSKLPRWDVCSDEVSSQYTRTYQDMYDVYRALLAAKKYRILIYNGDIDMACNFLGDEWFFDSMNMQLKEERRPWFFQDTDGSRQIGGYTKSWQSGIVFATVRGAGHMVPTDKPEQAYRMFSQFINNRPL